MFKNKREELKEGVRRYLNREASLFWFFFNFFHENVIKRHIWPPYLTQFPHYTRFYVPNFMFQYMVGSSNHKSTVVRLIKYHIQSLIMKISCYIPCLMILTPILPQNGLNHGWIKVIMVQLPSHYFIHIDNKLNMLLSKFKHIFLIRYVQKP